MKTIIKLSIAGSTLLLAGCATIKNVDLPHSYFKNKHHKVSVAHGKSMHAQYYQYGAQGLLDLALANMETGTFRHYLSTINNGWQSTLQNQFIQQLDQHHIKGYRYIKAIDASKLQDFNKNTQKYAVKNYMPLHAMVGHNELLTIQVNALGAKRHYYGFIPLGRPKAICQLTGRLINLKNNKILWRHVVTTSVPISGKWDQPPHYRNFTLALNKAVKGSSTELLDSFFTNY